MLVLWVDKLRDLPASGEHGCVGTVLQMQNLHPHVDSGTTDARKVVIVAFEIALVP